MPAPAVPLANRSVCWRCEIRRRLALSPDSQLAWGSISRGNRDVTIAVRMDETNEGIKDYYLLPAIDLTEAKMRLGENNHAMLDAYRFDDLEFFFEMAERISVEDAA